MKMLDPMTRPPVDQETLTFLRQLVNSGVFKLQYDAWAFGAALALRDGISPQSPGSGKEQLPPLSTLPEETRFALEQAAQAKLGNKEVEDMVEFINSLAIGGLKNMQEMMKDWSVQERINWVIKGASEKCN